MQKSGGQDEKGYERLGEQNLGIRDGKRRAPIRKLQPWKQRLKFVRVESKGWEKGPEQAKEQVKDEARTDMREREEKSENVVIYGIQEPASSEREDRKAEDLKKVEETMKKMDVETEADDMHGRRGRGVPGSLDRHTGRFPLLLYTLGRPPTLNSL